MTVQRGTGRGQHRKHMRREVDDRHHLLTVEEHIVRADVAVHELPGQLAEGSLMLSQAGRQWRCQPAW